MTAAGGPRRTLGFPWRDAASQLADFDASFPGAVADGRAFAAPGGAARLWPPLVLPAPRPGQTPVAYAAALPERLGRQCVLLLRAGAAALGYWDEDELVRHKVFKRYVVRGHGHAQQSWLKTRGKSRYGSRLRLQNRARLLAEVNGRLRLWWDELGAPEQVFWAMPPRSLPELFAAGPGPPLLRDDARLRRIPLHVHEPGFRELRRVRALLGRGRVELPAPG